MGHNKRYSKVEDKKIVSTININGVNKETILGLQKVLKGTRSVSAIKQRYYVLTKDKLSRKVVGKRTVTVNQKPNTASADLINLLAPHAKNRNQRELLVELFKNL